MVDSGSNVHTEHFSSWTTLLLVKFTAVGRTLWQALHANTLNLLGIRSFQIASQTCFVVQPLEVPTCAASEIILLAT